MFNPEMKYAHSKGIDLPLMYVYLAGYMSGEKLKECTEWRLKIREHYRKWEKKNFSKLKLAEYNGDLGYVEKPTYEWLAFPIAFLDPFNGKEIETIDKKGLTSSFPPNSIVHSDYMSVCKADIVVANLDTFGADRPSIGTHWELAWTWTQKKPFILIVPEGMKETYTKHPFTAQASWIVESVDELLDKKVLESFYKRIAGAIYE
jgi:hypothetical protein